jgi:hypothetical protein
MVSKDKSNGEENDGLYMVFYFWFTVQNDHLSGTERNRMDVSRLTRDEMKSADFHP